MDFRILGPLEVVEDGRRLTPRRAKQRALLAMLLLHANASVASDVLVDALWGERPPPTALTALHGHVSALRKLLGAGRIETLPPGYALRVEPGELDRDRFQAFAEEGRYAEALSLWRGPALAELAYEPFAQEHIAELEELRLVCVEARIDADLAASRDAELVGELEALVKGHPLRERFRAQLMLALYRSGRQAEALEAFRAARATLVEEIGIEPGEELKALQRQILAQDPALSARPAAGPATDRASSTGDLGRAVRRPRLRWLVGLAAGVLALAASAAAVLLLGDHTSPPVPLANSVVEIDPKTNELVSVVRVGEGAMGLATAGRNLWVANRRDDTLTRVDTRTHETRTFGGFAAPISLAVDGLSVWVGSDSRPEVVALDGTTGVVFDRVRLKGQPAAFVAFGDGSVWVSHGGLYGTLTTGAQSTLSRIELATGTVTTTRLGFDAAATSIALGSGAVWVTLSARGELARINATDGSRRDVTVGGFPLGVAADSGGIWVASFNDDVVRRVNPLTSIVEDVVHVGSEPFAVATGVGSVWVTNHRDCTVSRIDLATRRVVATIPTRFFPTGVYAGPDGVWVAVSGTELEGKPGRGPRCAGARPSS